MHNPLPHFCRFNQKDMLARTRVRRFETKLGERVHTISPADAIFPLLQSSPARYVIFGIPEDIGVLANQGIAGTATCWAAFLDAFLNVQSNDFLSGDQLLVLGYFDFSPLQQLIDSHAHDQEEKINAYRHALVGMDEEVETLVQSIIASGKIPIAIGGGHNNAYPLLKGGAKGLHQAGAIPLAQINCINLDAHADYRPTEGRHSGNAFRYAEEDGYLQKYCVVGLQENYLPQNVWLDIVNNPFIDVITYEDIFILEKKTFTEAVLHAIGFTDDTFTGVEVDLDSVEGVLSSARTPSGLQSVHARQFLYLTATHARPAYLHICEGAQRLATGELQGTIGKLISALVTDFLKAHAAVYPGS